MQTKIKLLVTGGAGFIGANFVHTSLKLGYKIHIIERKNTNFWRIKKIKDKLIFHSVNLINYEETEKLIAEIKPDIVVHFATYGAYQKFQQDIGLTIDTNLKATINLLNACHKVGIECFINTGTNSEYGIKDNPMKETDTLEADNLYAITKASATLYCQMMARKFDFPVVTVRPFAVYGYYEEKKRLIPSIIKSCLTNTKLELSHPDSVRDYIFIEDLINGYFSIIKNIKTIKGQIFNFGNGKQYSIDEVVSTIKTITDSDIKPTYGQIKSAQTEPKTWVSDISKAKFVLGWKPKYNLKTGLKKNISWFRNNLSLYENN